MKRGIILLMSLISFGVFAQKPKLNELKDAKNHAGCYVLKGNNSTIANLTETDEEGNDVAIFNFTGKDEYFKTVKGTKYYPMAFSNEKYQIFVHQSFLKKERGTCLDYYRYNIKIVFQGKSYFYQYKGFCGC